MGAIGAAVAGGVASAAIGSGISAIAGSGQSSAISAGQQQANAVLAPYSNTGVQSDTQTANLLGLNGQPAADAAMSTFQSSPGFQYQLSQGLKAVDAGAAATGMLRSGSTMQAEQTLGNNLANQDFQQYISNLNGLSNYGITAAGGQASTDTSAAGQQASIYGNTVNGISNALGGSAGTSSTQNGLSSLFTANGAPVPQTSPNDGIMVSTAGWGNATGGVSS
jgi:hypothetical protein